MAVEAVVAIAVEAAAMHQIAFASVKLIHASKEAFWTAAKAQHAQRYGHTAN